MKHSTWFKNRWLYRLSPWLLFALSAGLAAWLHGSGEGLPPVTGFAESTEEGVAPLEAGRLSALLVQPGESVEQGQALARLDGSSLEAELRVLEADEARLEAALQAADLEVRRGNNQDARTLIKQLDAARVALAQEQSALEQAKARENTLRDQRDRLQALVRQQLATGEELSRVEVALAEVSSEVQTLPRTVAHLEAQVADAERLLKNAPQGSVEMQTSPARGELEVVRRQLEWLRSRISGLELRASAPGKVASVQRQPGEVVQAGEAVLTLVPRQPSRVIACLSEAQHHLPKVGDRADLASREGDLRLEGTVSSLGAMVSLLPERCWQRVGVPQWGRTMTVQLAEAAEVLPGQAFLISVTPAAARMRPPAPPPPEEKGEALAGGMAAAAEQTLALNARPPQLVEKGVGGLDGEGKGGVLSVSRPLEPRKLLLPPGGNIHLEPSGLIWIPELERYIVVSDDTGAEKRDRHSPVLFAVSATGQVDLDPVPVRGIDSLDDLEAIAAGPSGRIFVLSSQSVNKHGKRSRARTALLELSREGRAFRVTGEVHLAEALEAGGSALLRNLGLTDGTKSLDLEGLAYHDGALYLGLKAPLDSSGRAAIWRISDPERLFRGASLEASGLKPYGSLALSAELEGRSVPGGISDLLFHPDGSLLLTSTPSGDAEGRPSGRLWQVARPAAGTLSARLVHTFDGLKPEGLSLGPVAGRLIVAFDTGGIDPLWLEAKWPF